jgi:hypothetical protein
VVLSHAAAALREPLLHDAAPRLVDLAMLALWAAIGLAVAFRHRPPEHVT